MGSSERYFVFYTNGGDNTYERTCGIKSAAIERVEYLKKHYENAEFFTNEIPKDYKWFY